MKMWRAKEERAVIEFAVMISQRGTEERSKRKMQIREGRVEKNRVMAELAVISTWREAVKTRRQELSVRCLQVAQMFPGKLEVRSQSGKGLAQSTVQDSYIRMQQSLLKISVSQVLTTIG